jgi:hypothetical protein
MSNKKIAVIGVGTAGITNLAHLLAFLPKDWTVYSISDPSIPMLGIGESTSTSIPMSLHYGADFSMTTDADYLDATVKHGTKYVNWRPHEFNADIPLPSFGIHFNNFKLKEFSFNRFIKKFKERFVILEGNISHTASTDTCANATINGIDHEFDYIIDCGGYPTDYSDYTLLDMPVNHCLVHTIKSPGDWNFTYHTAHANGWMFGIPLKTRQGWGYLYNDTITMQEDAKINLAETLGIEYQDLNLREFSFKNYRANKFLDGRILKNGNRALFYEPIEAMSGWFYDMVIRSFFDLVLFNQYSEEQLNYRLTAVADEYELAIHYLYHGGSTFDSTFWKITSEKSKQRLQTSLKFKQHIDNLQKYKHVTEYPDAALPFPASSWKMFDRQLNYHYFTSAE